MTGEPQGRSLDPIRLKPVPAGLSLSWDGPALTIVWLADALGSVCDRRAGSALHRPDCADYRGTLCVPERHLSGPAPSARPVLLKAGWSSSR